MPVEPVLVMSPDRASFDGRVDRVVLKVRAWDEFEKPAGGLVSLTAPVGEFIGGSELVLDKGFVSATFACDPDREPACLGPIRLNVEWNGLNATSQVVGYLENPPTPVDWEVVPTTVSGQLSSLATSRDGVVWGVGERGAAVQLVGRTWRALYTGVTVDLHAVVIGPEGTPIAVGDEGVVLRWTAAGYERWSAGDFSLRAIAFDDHQTLHLGTADGQVLIETAEGFVPELQLSTPVRSLVNKDGEVWATGDGVLAKWSGGAWVSLPSPVSGRLDVAIAGKESLWLLGQREGVHTTQGLLVSGPMPTWKTSALAEPVRGVVEVPGTSERFAFGASQVFRQLDDGAWSAVVSPAVGMRAGASRGPNDLVLVGPQGFSLLRKH